MSYFFFTEPDKLNIQQEKAFGPDLDKIINGVNYEQFLVTSGHTAASDANAISICDGQLFVQEQISDSNLLNIIFKPIIKEPFTFPKIKYFIYKGIKKDSLVATDNIHVAAVGSNFLVDMIWDTFKKFNTSGSPEKSTLGLHNLISELSDNEMIEDVFSLSSREVIFWNLKGGVTIGSFDKNSIGFEIILDTPFYKPKLELTRNQLTYIYAKKLTPDVSHQDFFEHWHDKEAIINFIDPSAFFGCFYSDSLSVIDGGTVKKWKGEELINNVINKFLNKHKCYIDIRNEFNFSINYFKNYGLSPIDNNTSLRIRLGSNPAINTINYYKNNWPNFYIDQDDPLIASLKYQILNIQLPSGDNLTPVIYIEKAYLPNENFPNEYQNSEKIKTLLSENDYSQEFSLALPCLQGKFISSYTILKYSRHSEETNANAIATQIKRTNYLDALFPIAINFDYQHSSYKSKVYDMEIYIDVSDSHHYEGVVSLGLSYDGSNIMLIANPTLIKTNEIKRHPLSIISDFNSFSSSNVLEELNKQELTSELVKTTINISNSEHEVLQFKTNNTDFEGKFNVPDLRKVIGINITNEQWESIISASLNFLQKYPIYLSVINKEHLEDDDGKYYTSLDLGLKGYQFINNKLSVSVLPANINLITYGIV